MIHLNHMLEATNGVLIYPGKQHHFDAFSHDTRQLIPGEMFVAVRGEQGDGHDYLLDAVHRGAAGLLLEAQFLTTLAEGSRATLERAGVATISVPDTRVALQQYASFILQRWHPTVIAVSGSTGKTSTKEAIASVLSSNFSTFRSWQNYNDLLGLPLSLGRLEAHHEYAVLELGCDHPGEISELCRIAQPQIGILTNISPTQLQYFGDLEHLASELGTLFTFLPPSPGGTAIFNQDDTHILDLLTILQRSTFLKVTGGDASVPTPLHTTPAPTDLSPARGGDASVPTDLSPARTENLLQATQVPFAPSLVHNLHVGWSGVRCELPTLTTPPGVQLTSHLLGAHHTSTMLAAYTVGRLCGLADEAIQHALAELKPLPGRLNPLAGIYSTTLLDDTHNAAPASVIAGLETLKALPAGRRIAILGDMLRLGPLDKSGGYEEEAHRLVGQKAAQCVDYLITRGERAALIAQSARQAGLSAQHIIITSTHEDAAEAARHLITLPSKHHTTERHAQDVLLIKGSEETRMEKV